MAGYITVVSQHSCARYGTSSYKLSVKKIPEVSETIQALAIPLDYPSELGDNTLLLKAPYTLAARQ